MTFYGATTTTVGGVSPLSALSLKMWRVFCSTAATTFSAALAQQTNASDRATVLADPSIGIFLSTKHDPTSMTNSAITAQIWLDIKAVMAGFPDDGRDCYFTVQHEPENNGFPVVGGDSGAASYRACMGKLRQVADQVNATRNNPVKVGPVCVGADADPNSGSAAFKPYTKWLTPISPAPHYIGIDEYGQRTQDLATYDAFASVASAYGCELVAPEAGNHPDATTTQSTDQQMLTYMQLLVAKAESTTPQTRFITFHQEGVNDLSNKPNSTAYWKQKSFTSGQGFGDVLNVAVSFAADMHLPNEITQIKDPVKATPQTANNAAPTITVPVLTVAGMGFLTVTFSGPDTNMVTPFPGWTLRGSTMNGTAYSMQTYARALSPADNGSVHTAALDTTHKWDTILDVYPGADPDPTHHPYLGQAETVQGTAHDVPLTTVIHDSSRLYELVSDRDGPGSTVFTPDGSQTLRSFVTGAGTGSTSLASSDSGDLAAGTYGPDTWTGDLSTTTAITASIAISPGAVDQRAAAGPLNVTAGLTASMQNLGKSMPIPVLPVTVGRTASMVSNQQMTPAVLAVTVARDVDADKTGGGALSHGADGPDDIIGNTSHPIATYPATAPLGSVVILAVEYTGADAAMTVDPFTTDGPFTLLGTITKSSTIFTVRVYGRVTTTNDPGDTINSTLSAQSKWDVCLTVYPGASQTLDGTNYNFIAQAGSSNTNLHTTPILSNFNVGAWEWSFCSDRNSPGSSTLTPSGGITKRSQAVNVLGGAATLATADSNGPIGTGLGAAGGRLWTGTVSVANALYGTMVILPGSGSDSVDVRGVRGITASFTGAVKSNQGIAGGPLPVTAAMTGAMVNNAAMDAGGLNIDVGMPASMSRTVAMPATTRLVTVSFAGAMVVQSAQPLAAQIMAVTVGRTAAMIRVPGADAFLPVTVGFKATLEQKLVTLRLKYDGLTAQVDDHERVRNGTNPLWHRVMPPPSQRALLLYMNGTVIETDNLYGDAAQAADYVVAGGHEFVGTRNDWQIVVLENAGYTLEVVT